MITRTAVIDGLDHTFIMPIINSVKDDIKRTIMHDSDIFDHHVTMNNISDSEFEDYLYDNTLGGPTLNIAYEVEYKEENRKGTSIYTPLNKIILIDKDNGFNIRPNYVTATLHLKFRYIGQSRILIQRMVNKLKTFYDFSGYTLTHDLNYSFLIPNVVLGLMDNINKLKDTNLSLNEYVNSITPGGIDIAIKPNSDREVPVFRGYMDSIFGYLDDQPADLTIDKNSDTSYSVEFAYSLTVKIPNSLTIQYPILVNNKPIDKHWLPAERMAVKVDKAEGKLNIIDIIRNYHEFKSSYTALYKVPTYDNFYPKEYIRGDLKLPLISILLSVDPNALNNILSLDSLKYIGLPDCLITYFKSRQGNELFEISNSIFLLELYKNNNVANYGLNVVGNEIIADKPLDITKSYHIVISIMLDKGMVGYYRHDLLDKDKVQEDDILLDKLHIKLKYTNDIPIRLDY